MSCPECSLPRSKNSLPAATLWKPSEEEEEKDDDDDNQQDKIAKRTHMLPVAYAFDSRMELHEECDPSDPFEVHPERPVRIRSIFEHLKALGLLGRLVRRFRAFHKSLRTHSNIPHANNRYVAPHVMRQKMNFLRVTRRIIFNV